MEITKLIIIIQFVFGFTCLLIQLYALCSVRWTTFESRVDLGLIEEHGHYGLWSMCTYRKLIPAQVDEDGKLIIDPDCDSIDTYFTPGHPRAFISFFVICHTFLLIIFCSLVLFRLIELYYECWNKNKNDDLEMNTNKVKRIFVIINRILVNRVQLNNDQEYYVRTQIRNKLYVISVAVLSTMLALAGALTPQQSLRETDIFFRYNVSRNNYRIWRGPGFWAQMTTMIMDMLITILIVIEVRVIFSMFQQQSYRMQSSNVNQTLPNDTIETLQNDNIVNPFFRNPSVNDHHDSIPERSVSVNLEMTIPKTLHNEIPESIQTGNENDKSHYINSEEVRKMKNQKEKTSSYCNPMYKDD